MGISCKETGVLSKKIGYSSKKKKKNLANKEI
jgi:hypothetical protein